MRPKDLCITAYLGSTRYAFNDLHVLVPAVSVGCHDTRGYFA